MSLSSASGKQYFDYLLVVDFEATCQENAPWFPNEIIEFPIVVVDCNARKILRDKCFHSYVKPWRRPKLTEFCTDLTGITQSDVDGAPPLPQVIQMITEWLHRTFPVDAKIMFATDGPWDFKNFLHKQAVLRDHVSVPTVMYEYIDIRTTFARKLNRGDPIKLNAMLQRMKMRFEGRPHCGFDDTINIARLAIAMMERGIIFDFIVAIPQTDPYCFDLENTIKWAKNHESGHITAHHAAAAYAFYTGPGRITKEGARKAVALVTCEELHRRAQAAKRSRLQVALAPLMKFSATARTLAVLAIISTIISLLLAFFGATLRK